MNAHFRKAEEIASHLASLPQVSAMAIGGSQSSGAADSTSDIDLYVYTTSQVSSADLLNIIRLSGGASRTNLGLSYWGGTDAWIDAQTGIEIDWVGFSQTWMQEQIENVMKLHQPALGYSTCFCRTVKQSIPLFDPHGWLAEMQMLCRQDYPQALQRNIIAHNHPVLRTIMPSYLHQIESAVRRNDIVSINHRLAALLASYFDIVFACNRILHPGEKRIIATIKKECSLVPESLEEDVNAVIKASATGDVEIIVLLHRLLNHLDALLVRSGLDLPTH